MHIESRLTELREATGITDFEDVSPEQFATVLKKAAEGSLTLEQLALLVQVMPQFVELQRQTIDGLKTVVEAAGGAQKRALKAVGRSLDAAGRALEALAQNAQDDTVRLELAKMALELGRMGLEIAKIVEGMNRDNNNLWKYVASVAGVVAVAVIVILRPPR